MALIVEDGTGVADAESYATVAAADARLSDLGLIDWTGLTTAEKEQALRRATAYMEQAYRSRWQGVPRFPRSSLYAGEHTQALSWPRYDVYVDCYPVDYQSVPPEVSNACIDLALKAAAGELNADLTQGIVSESVGPISTEYDPHSPQSVRYRSIDMMLAPFLTSGGSSVKLVRA